MKTTPHDCFSEDRQGIAYREYSAPLASIILACFSLMALVVSAGFFTEVMSWPWHGGKVAGLLALPTFAGFGLYAGLLALAGLMPQTLRFDAETKRAHGRASGRFWPLRSIDASFASLQRPVIKSIERELDTELYEIRVEWPGHLSLALGSYEKRSHAEYWRDRLDRLLKD